MKIIKKKRVFPKYQEIEVSEPSAAQLNDAYKKAVKLSLPERAVLISMCCTFDGKKIPPEEVLKMKGDDFLQLVIEVNGIDPLTLEQ